MPKDPKNFADPPARLDALSDVLESIHLRGGPVTANVGATPAVHPAGTRLLHVVSAGRVRVEIDGAEETVLGPDAMALIARGHAHTLRPVGEASWITGGFRVEQGIAEPLLRGLPTLIVVDRTSTWLPLSIDLIRHEVDAPSAGSRVMLSRILDLLFIHALRAWAASVGAASPGWLTAAMDPMVSPALAAMHAAPGAAWSVTDLAGLANVSRSAFATRFRELMGVPPAAYVNQHRLDLAAHLLLAGDEPAAVIARTVGYASEASFSRAFTRRYGSPPRRWRTAQPEPEGLASSE